MSARQKGIRPGMMRRNITVFGMMRMRTDKYPEYRVYGNVYI